MEFCFDASLALNMRKSITVRWLPCICYAIEVNFLNAISTHLQLPHTLALNARTHTNGLNALLIYSFDDGLNGHLRAAVFSQNERIARVTC